jgi:hypothetical protein
MPNIKKIIPQKKVNEIQVMLKNKTSIREISKKVNVSSHQVFKIKNGIDSYSRGNLISVNSVSDKVYKDLHNIADNLNMKFPEFMKMELKKITTSYPEKMKQPVI